MFRLIIWHAQRDPLAISKQEANHQSTEQSGHLKPIPLSVNDLNEALKSVSTAPSSFFYHVSKGMCLLDREWKVYRDGSVECTSMATCVPIRNDDDDKPDKEVSTDNTEKGKHKNDNEPLLPQLVDSEDNLLRHHPSSSSVKSNTNEKPLSRAESMHLLTGMCTSLLAICKKLSNDQGACSVAYQTSQSQIHYLESVTGWRIIFMASNPVVTREEDAKDTTSTTAATTLSAKLMANLSISAKKATSPSSTTSTSNVSESMIPVSLNSLYGILVTQVLQHPYYALYEEQRAFSRPGLLLALDKFVGTLGKAYYSVYNR